MSEIIDLRVTPHIAADDALISEELKKLKPYSHGMLPQWRILSRSIDARQKKVLINLRVEVASPGEDLDNRYTPEDFAPLAADAPVVIIVGAGPAGLFAALRAIQLGMRPIIFERGKDVDSRRHDIAVLCRQGIVDADSNYCFGEGGAGAYSDGKLYTRSKKRGSVLAILTLLHQHGADESILIDAHPHIGSDRLPEVIRNIRNTIIRCGGEVHFQSPVSELILSAQRHVTGVILRDGTRHNGPVILATGHSARDVYRMLHRLDIPIQAKGLAIGVRLEHPQQLIDSIQYHNPKGRGKWLPAAEYSFVCQVDGRGVYSFCMCPGGVVVPSASAAEQLAVNGMSASARVSRWANAGMVVEIHPEDFPEYPGPLGMLELQETLERNFYMAAGKTQLAPAQRMADFVKGKVSADLPDGSYAPGMISLPVHFLLPEFISSRLRKGFEVFGRRAKGFLTNEATVVGLESRTSSPVRIPRDKVSFSHPDIPGLYPVGEGAGYAGGIVSAAIDGQRAAEAVAGEIRDKR